MALAEISVGSSTEMSQMLARADVRETNIKQVGAAVYVYVGALASFRLACGTDDCAALLARMLRECVK